MAQDIQSQLNTAIEAARRGDRVTAQRLLQAVVRQDHDNELAWMWLASTSTTAADKRRYLQRVLAINPNNQTAQAALQQLGGANTSAAQQPATANSQTPPWRNLVTIAIALAGIASVVILGAVIFNAVRSALQTEPDITAVVAFETQFASSQTPATQPPTALPTVTVTPASILVTPDPATLPPTFTPTPQPTATETPIPSATPLPVSSYSMIFTSLEAGDEFASPILINGDGSGESELNALAREAVYSPDGSQIAFLAPASAIAEVSEDESDEADSPSNTAQTDGSVELFVVSADDLQDVIRLTNFGADDLTGVTWSPDGTEILYIRDRVNLEGVQVDDPGNVTEYLVGEDTGVKTGATWSPDGNRIVFAADGGIPGGPLEIYALDVATDDIEQLTNDAGSSFSPVFSPDGTQIAFISDRNGDGDVFVMEASGSATRLLTQDDQAAEDQTPTWSPDGRWIAFSSTRGAQDSFQIFMINPETAEVLQVTENSRNNLSPSFRPT